jgi:protein phosphatase 1A
LYFFDLFVSRLYDPEIVTCEPYLGQVALSSDADFVVIASDGIWDCLSFQEVADMVVALNGPSQVKCAELLVDEAIKRGSQDNCTAVVVFFNNGKHQ